MSAEREVKLEAPPGFRLPAIGDGSAGDPPDVLAGPGTTERTLTTYLDTEDLRIARWGSSLRYRAGEGWTVKLPAAREGSALVREEHRFRGGPARPPDAAIDLLRAYVRRAPLSPVARLQTLRTTIPLRDAAGRRLGAIVDDEVSVLDGRRVAARFREVEVEAADELPREGLERLVARIRAAGAGEPTTTPKVVRALGSLAAGPPELVARELAPDASTAEVIAAAIAASAIRLLRNDAGVRLGDDPEAVHQARVATRRLRSDLRTYRELLDPDWTASLRGELRWLGRELGDVRDAEVLEGRLRETAASLPEVDGTAAARLLRQLRDRRDEARAALLAMRDSPRYVDLLERIVEAANAPAVLDEAHEPALARLPRVMDKPWGDLRATAEGMGADAADEELHAARIRTKRARYAAETMLPVYGKRARAFARAAAKLQDVLGEHQDAVVAQRWLRGAASGPRTAFVAGELAALERRAAARARRRWPDAWKTLARKRPFWT